MGSYERGIGLDELNWMETYLGENLNAHGVRSW